MKTDILKNIYESSFEYRRSILFVYLGISLMHMPMVFISGKEAILGLYLEFRYRQISTYCEKVRSDQELRATLVDMEFKAKSFVREMSNWEYYSITGIIYLFTFTIAFFVEDLGQIVSFLGTFICFLV